MKDKGVDIVFNPKTKSNNVLGGIMGLAVADALGVPVEFESRSTLKKNPVVGMRAYGTYNQPAGTWSDDTSMTLCLADSLCKGLDYYDIMDNFLRWFDDGEFTPYGVAFDIGNTTREALIKYKNGNSPLECGGQGEYDNGNGSLMRILPISFYLQSIYGIDFQKTDEAFDIIHNVSLLTHGHKRSLMACGIYISVAMMLLGGMNLETAVDQGIDEAIGYYERKDEFKSEVKHFSRLKNKNFKNLPQDEINSGGYVVSTLEAAIWCLLNTDDYKSCVLKAVNLGDDTDTVGAVAGGLAGIHYGYESIPEEWTAKIARRDYIENLCSELYINLTRNSVKKLLSYIPYFESARDVEYPARDEELLEFADTFYKTNLISYNYLVVLRSYNLHTMDQIESAIETADLELLKAILTGYIRQDRFIWGLWEYAVREKVFLRILNRFNEILQEIT